MNRPIGLAVALAVGIACLAAMTVLSAPGASRLPWSDVQDLLRLQVMGPGSTQAPTKEYVLQASEPIQERQLQQLEELGIEVVSVEADVAIVRGDLTAFSGLLGEDESLAWVTGVLPNLPMQDSAEPKYYAITLEQAIAACGLDPKLLAPIGDGVVVAVIDSGFTDEITQVLGADQVCFLKMSSPDKSGKAQLVAGRELDAHGTMCAEAIARIVPRAKFLLFSASNPLDRQAMLSLIAEGAKIDIGGQTIDLSTIDVVSNSNYWPVPQDHNDGKGKLARAADAVVTAGIPFVYALGNFGEGTSTDRSFFAASFEDTDNSKLHDFDPGSTSLNDRNSLSIKLDPWDGKDPATVTVILEWDGWPYQVNTGSPEWTRDEIASIQDIDLYVYREDSVTKSLVKVTQSDYDQLTSLSAASGGLKPVDPLEVVQFTVTEPGTYLLVVRNATADHPGNLKTRRVNFHMYAFVGGTTLSMEHHTQQGALVNVGGAEKVIGVGAVGFTTALTWCQMPFSTQGPTTDGRLKPELVAPTAYVSPLTGQVFSGTSASAPLVAGIVAWLRAQVPGATTDQLREALCRSAASLSGDCNSFPGTATCPFCEECNFGVGCGMVDAKAAYQYLLSLGH